MDFYVDEGVRGDDFVPLRRGMDAVPEEISIGINIGNNRKTQSRNWVKERGGIHDVAKSEKSGSPSYRLEELADFDVGNSNSPKVTTQALQLSGEKRIESGRRSVQSGRSSRDSIEERRLPEKRQVENDNVPCSCVVEVSYGPRYSLNRFRNKVHFTRS